MWSVSGKNSKPSSLLQPGKHHFYMTSLGFSSSSVGKESACSAGDLSSIPGLGRSPGEGNGNPPQYPWTEEPGGLQSVGSQRVGHD